MNNYNYIATVHKPTVATHSTVGHFTSAEDLNLIVARQNYIEIYDVSCEGRLRLMKDFPVNGSITTVKLLRVSNQTRDFLLLGVEGDNNQCVKFYVQSWDADKNDLITRDSHEILGHIGEGEQICFFNHDDSLIGLRTLSSRRNGPPLNSVKFIHITQGGAIVVDFSISFDTLQEALWYDAEQEILDIKFLNSDEWILAVLYKEGKVATYKIDIIEDEVFDGYQYGLVKGPWSRSTYNAAKFLIPVPSPCGGVLAVGDKSVTYCSKSMPVVVQFIHDFLFDKSRNDVRGCFGLWYNFGDTIHGALSDGRFLFSSQSGKLQMLVLTQDDKNDTQLDLKLLGETSFASTLSYLCGDVLYLGSRSGDSELIKLNSEPTISGDYKIEVLERFFNLGPVFDCCFSKLGQQGQLVTCSGGFDDGSLRVLRKKFQITEKLFGEFPGIEGMWHVKISKLDFYNGLLVVSSQNHTFISQISSEGGLNLIPFHDVGFSMSDRTMLCYNTSESIVIQVTSTTVRLVCLSSKVLKYEWKAPHKILHASANDTEVLLSTEDAHLYYLEIVDKNTLEVKETKKLDSDIATLVVGLTGDAHDDTKLAAVGSWFRNSITIYSLPELTVHTVKDLEEQPRSLLMCRLEGVIYLFCGTAEGSLVYFIVDSTGDLTSMKNLSFGRRPVTLQLIEHQSARQVFISCDQPALIYSTGGILHMSSLNRQGINQVCSFSTTTIQSGLAIATSERLTLEDLNEIEIDVSSHYLQQQPLCIAHQRQSETFTVSCVKSSELSELSSIKLFNALTFDVLDTYTLKPGVYGVALSSCEFSSDDQEYVCLGTEGSTFLERRIMVFVIKEQSLKLVAETSMLFGGPVFCLAAFKGMLIASYGVRIVLYKWDKDAGCLVEAHQYEAAAGEYASCLQCRGDYIFSNVRLMHFQEGTGIKSLACYRSHKLTAVDVLEAGVYVGCTEKHILFFHRAEGAADEDNDFQAVGSYYLGDQVRCFSHGSLISAGEITTALFGTINGGIGVIASLPEESYEVLHRLQGVLRRDAADEDWRSYHHKIEPAASSLLDGDLIKTFSDMELTKRNQIAQGLNLLLEDLDKKVKEVTHLH